MRLIGVSLFHTKITKTEKELESKMCVLDNDGREGGSHETDLPRTHKHTTDGLPIHKQSGEKATLQDVKLFSYRKIWKT